MSYPIHALIESRRSINYFDSKYQLDDELIEKLAELATRSPSAFNLQNWQFIAVRSQSEKLRLQKVCFGQQKVVDASVTFIVCGVLNAYERLASVLDSSVRIGAIPPMVAESWVTMASASQHEQPQAQRDEAIRSASLASMTLMLAAEGMGLGSCPMTGFDSDALINEFALGNELLPVLLVTIGRPLDNNWLQKPRKALTDVLVIC